MKPFTWNLMLALAWSAMTGEFTLLNLGFGFALGYLILFFAQRMFGHSNYYHKLFLIGSFIVFYIYDVITATIRVAYDVVTPTHYMKPGVVAIPLDARTDVEITLLSNLITMTPGTLAMDVSSDRRVLYIHAMYVEDEEALVHSIKHGLERRVLELLR
jgi:multicomponent Na+:H+ antiporter subunit E